MAFTDGSTVAFTVAGVTYRYNLASSQGSAGIWTVQNVTPTFTQAKAGDALDNEVQPFAEVSYSDWTGSMGLFQNSDDPGDLTRPFFSNLDTSRPRQLTSLSATKTGVSTIGGGQTIDTAGTIFQWVNSAAGPGFVAKRSGSANYAYWRWVESTFTWTYQLDVNGTPATGGDFAGANRAVTGSMHKPLCTVLQFGSALWMCNGTGLTNINVAAAAPAGTGVIGNLVGTAKFFDQLVTFAVNNNNIDVVCYNDSGGDATLTRTQSIGADGTSSNNIAKIRGESVLMGTAALNGNLFVFTDKSLYALQWIEATNVFVVEPIIENTAKFTSNPCVFANELYIGNDNQLWHWTPGQGNNDFKPIDPTGWLPAPYNGRITELHPFMQTLAVKVVNLAGSVSAAFGRVSDAVILRYTALGAWQALAVVSSNEAPSSLVMPMLKTQDGTNFSTIHTPKNTNTLLTGTVFESGQNIRNTAAGNATQGFGGIHVTPWFYGTTRTAQKQLLRSRWEVDSTANAISPGFIAYIQKDNDDGLADSPTWAAYTGGSGLGTFKLASPSVTASATGDASSALNSSGTGVLWSEYDGSNAADWHGATAYPTFKRLRWLYLFNSASALPPPSLLSHSYQYLEYAFKFYVINTTIHLEINMDHPNNPGSALTTPALLMAEVARIQGWDYGKSIITVVGPDNVSYPSVITKYLANVTKIQPNGVWSVDLSLTLQCVKLFGLAI